MTEGFVYILINPSFPSHVKIGRTTKKPELRARELQSTGVPTPFIVVYHEIVSDCKAVESKLHDKFTAYRTSSNCEFFRVPVRDAILALQEEAEIYKVDIVSAANRISILSTLRQRYGGYLKPDIVDVDIVQLPEVCFIEVVRQTYATCRDRVIEQMDLEVFGLDDGKMFSTTNSTTTNAQLFLSELDDYDLIMTGVPIFTSEACQKIADEWQKPGGKLEQLRSQRKN